MPEFTKNDLRRVMKEKTSNNTIDPPLGKGIGIMTRTVIVWLAGAVEVIVLGAFVAAVVIWLDVLTQPFHSFNW